MPSKPPESATVSGVRVTHPDRVVYPEDGLTKLDVVRYYDAIGDRMVPHVKGRPLTLVACLRGLAQGCQYLRHSKLWGPQIRRVKIRERTKIGEYMIADSAKSLLWLAQFNVLEIHTWNSNFDQHVEQPNRIVLDLDPGEYVTWGQVIAAARLVRRLLNALDLEAWIKTTGGRGLHVVAPIKPERNWSQCLAFAKAIAELLVTQDFELYTTNFKKIGREKKILIDYLRNNRTNTSIAAYSLRARDGAPVSMPIAWTDLKSNRTPDRFALSTIDSLRRIDPWRNYWTSRQRLTAAVLKAVGAP
jgi:bifunctional non-homologous end joining protein LigD